jgi:hypothetical protein
MATRGTIAVELTNGEVIQCYSHWDNYLEGVGKTLQDHYNDRGSAQALVQLGNISSVGERIVPLGQHSFEKPEPGTTVYYGRDRDETGQHPRVFKSISKYYDTFNGEEYDYLFTGGQWTVRYGPSRRFIPLKDALCDRS